MDIYLFSTIANIIWQIFTILFVLYRFTSFFSIIYNFTKFLGKIFKGFVYVKDQINSYFIKRNGYNLHNNELNTQPKSTFQTIYDYLFKKREVNVQLPLYETTTSFVNEFDFNIESNFQNIIDDKSDSSGFSIERKNTDRKFDEINSSICSSIYIDENRFNIEDSNMLLNSNFILNNIK